MSFFNSNQYSVDSVTLFMLQNESIMNKRCSWLCLVPAGPHMTYSSLSEGSVLRAPASLLILCLEGLCCQGLDDSERSFLDAAPPCMVYIQPGSDWVWVKFDVKIRQTHISVYTFFFHNISLDAIFFYDSIQYSIYRDVINVWILGVWRDA